MTANSSLRLILLLLLAAVFMLIPTRAKMRSLQAAVPSPTPGWSPEIVTPAHGALAFNGRDEYVRFDAAPELALPAFTLELWFNWSGGGVATRTGYDGVTAYPLLARGLGRSQEGTADMNYFLGIHSTERVLVADLEEVAAGDEPGQNHPIRGVTTIDENTWYHAAATFDGYRWQLFLNGRLESEIVVARPPVLDGVQPASLATALDAAGTPTGFFAGALDEVRIWNTARSEQALRTSLNAQLTEAQPGLVARWSLDGAPQRIVRDSAGQSLDGTAAVASDAAVAGAPFNLAPSDLPSGPVLVQPSDTAVGVATAPTLEVTVDDPEADTMTVTFYGRPLTDTRDDFTLIALPDTQKYAASASRNYIFLAQTQWIVDNKAARNIAHVMQLGDCVDNGDVVAEWDVADAAFSLIEDPATTGLADGIPYSMTVGNHDQEPVGDPDGDSTALYNQYFGINRFSGRSYYGGYFGSNFDNHYELFSAAGMDFIIISLEYAGSPTAVLDWADGLLATYSDRRAIVITHFMVDSNGSFSSQGQAIYNALKDRPNLFLLHGGHKSDEEYRSDTYGGSTVHSLLADYQSRTNGGDGWLRIMTFSPDNDEVRVQTYSPTRNEFETDTNSAFTFSYEMPGAPDFQMIGQVSSVAAGAQAAVTWSGLANETEYEWYVTLDDGSGITKGPTWTFTTAALQAPDPAVLSLSRQDPALELAWVPAVGATVDHYEVWRSVNAPYFDPADAGCDCAMLAEVDDTRYTDNDTAVTLIGDPDHTYSYLVIAVNAAGASAPSNRVAAFDFALQIPGN